MSLVVAVGSLVVAVGSLVVAVGSLVVAVGSLVVLCGLSSCAAQAPECLGSSVAAHGSQFPNQRLNPCPHTAVWSLNHWSSREVPALSSRLSLLAWLLG